MFENTTYDAFSGCIPETPSDDQEGVSGASQPNTDLEQGSEPIRGVVAVPASLRIWAPDNQLLGQCRIETYAKGDGCHYFMLPIRINLSPGARVEIEVENE